MDFSTITGLLPDSTLGYLNLAGLIVAASSVFAASISKLTKNKTDDKIAGWLKKAHDLLGFVGLHGASLDQKRAMPTTVPSRNGGPPVPVRNHRKPR